ncbi:LacI family DNA-binding transcriptional regulator [Microlunatus soli]|uniref:Transcriptional regulator, LacI family n=1 Tax=Microlunatus soli TaxID=630515 RepID=A0A1H1W8B0_9ACTN|nr:LacI family DNA-binding transcriptional regulator [Microlunatus soli]SDS93285.1 transcriptional regulator, LacI family [Microlunatus soli]
MSPASARPTITDVAQAAGASRSTTSRALSGTGYVSPEVRDRVRKAAKRLGYVPDAMARGLKQRTSTTIGLLVSDLRNSFYAQLASGASQAARQRGFAIMLTDTGGHRHDDDPAATATDEVEAADIFLGQRVAGVIVTPVSATVTRHLTDRQLAVVEVDRSFGSKAADAVMVSNADGAGEATEHLIGLGHRRIALIIDELDWTTGRQRHAGYEAALRAAGLPVSEDLVVASGWNADDARRAVSKLLQRPDRPTAVFAANNVIAEGAWRAAADLELAIPGELSLIGFDDAPWMSMVSPPVSTVTQNPYALGEAAVRQLLERIAEPDAPRRQIVLGTELLGRGSTGPVPADH